LILRVFVKITYVEGHIGNHPLKHISMARPTSDKLVTKRKAKKLDKNAKESHVKHVRHVF
jgi:hypothetical protein